MGASSSRAPSGPPPAVRDVPAPAAPADFDAGYVEADGSEGESLIFSDGDAASSEGYVEETEEVQQVAAAAQTGGKGGGKGRGNGHGRERGRGRGRGRGSTPQDGDGGEVPAAADAAPQLTSPDSCESDGRGGAARGSGGSRSADRGLKSCAHWRRSQPWMARRRAVPRSRH